MSSNDALNETYILFEIAGTTYAVRSRSVQQVEMIEHITAVPNAPPFVEGVVFTRGQIVPAVDLRARFGFEKAPHTMRTRLIVTNTNGRLVGLIVDSSREFMAIAADTIQPPPETLAGTRGKYLKGIVTIDDRVVLLVSLAELLDPESVEAAGGIYEESKSRS